MGCWGCRSCAWVGGGLESDQGIGWENRGNDMLFLLRVSHKKCLHSLKKSHSVHCASTFFVL